MRDQSQGRSRWANIRTFDLGRAGRRVAGSPADLNTGLPEDLIRFGFRPAQGLIADSNVVIDQNERSCFGLSGSARYDGSRKQERAERQATTASLLHGSTVHELCALLSCIVGKLWLNLH